MSGFGAGVNRLRKYAGRVGIVDSKGATPETNRRGPEEEQNLNLRPQEDRPHYDLRSGQADLAYTVRIFRFKRLMRS